MQNFQKIRGRSGTKHSDLLSDHSCSAYDPDRACYGNSGFFAAAGVFAYYRYMAMKYFGGTTGDLSGWFLCLCELAIVLVTAALSVILI